MKLQDYRDTFYTFTGKASDISRQLAFAAIAVIWLFKSDEKGQLSIPNELVLPGILVVSALTLDLLQYCLGAGIWYSFYRSQEKQRALEDKEITHSVWLERPLSAIFWIKVALVVAAYCLILVYLVRMLGFK
jgi:hypothetical protein